jgi:hypothetical protein
VTAASRSSRCVYSRWWRRPLRRRRTVSLGVAWPSSSLFECNPVRPALFSRMQPGPSGSLLSNATRSVRLSSPRGGSRRITRCIRPALFSAARMQPGPSGSLLSNATRSVRLSSLECNPVRPALFSRMQPGPSGSLPPLGIGVQVNRPISNVPRLSLVAPLGSNVAWWPIRRCGLERVAHVAFLCGPFVRLLVACSLVAR